MSLLHRAEESMLEDLLCYRHDVIKLLAKCIRVGSFIRFCAFRVHTTIVLSILIAWYILRLDEVSRGIWLGLGLKDCIIRTT